jgi:hypothetical protein
MATAARSGPPDILAELAFAQMDAMDIDAAR